MIAQLDSKYIRYRPTKVYSRLLSYFLFEGRPLTTRGQWINKVVSVFFLFLKKLPPLKRVKQPVFIIGTGRSGTTVLGVVLSMHKDVRFMNEPKALWYSVNPLDDLIGSYSRGEASYRLGVQDGSVGRSRAVHKLYGALLALTFGERIVDKYPEMIFRVPYLKQLFPEAKFLFLVRNGWDTCHSIDGWSSRLTKQVANETHNWWGADNRKWHCLVDQLVPGHRDLVGFLEEMREWDRHTDMAILEWILSMREGLSLLEEYPEDILQVKYEKLCGNPTEELKRILAHVNLSHRDEIFFNYAEDILNLIDGKAEVTLHPCLELPFRETMRRLGYDS